MKAFTIALMLGIGLFIYEISAASTAPVIPESADNIKPLQAGTRLPKLNLTTSEGRKFNLAEVLQKQPVILIFYRGGWCPYCNAQLGQLQKINIQLQKLAYRIIAVSPDRPEQLRQSLYKHKLSYTLVSDYTMFAARALGIAFRVDDATLKKYKGYGIDLEKASGQKHHQLPVPSVFIIGQDRVIKYTYTNSNYKKRLNPEKLLAAAKATLTGKQIKRQEKIR